MNCAKFLLWHSTNAAYGFIWAQSWWCEDLFDVTMDAFEKLEPQADIFKACCHIYVHCCDISNLFNFSVPSLPFLRLNGLFAHFSFFDYPSQRWICILPLSETLLQKFDGCNSPVVVNVKSSVIFELCFCACQLPLKLICIWASIRMSYWNHVLPIMECRLLSSLLWLTL